MKRLKLISIIEFKLFLRNWFNIMFGIGFPVIVLLITGSVYGNKPSALLGGHGPLDTSMAANTCMIIAIIGLLCLPLTVARYRERKILKRFMATPIHPADILVSQAIVNFLMVLVSMAVLILLGKVVFDLHFFGQLLPAAVSLIIIALAMFSIGLLISGVIPDSKASTVVSFVVYFPMLYLSGIGVPLQSLPQNIQAVSKMLPLTHGVNLLNGVWMGGSLFAHTNDILFLLATFVVCMGISIKLFRWESA